MKNNRDIRMETLKNRYEMTFKFIIVYATVQLEGKPQGPSLSLLFRLFSLTAACGIGFGAGMAEGSVLTGWTWASASLGPCSHAKLTLPTVCQNVFP